MLFMATGTGLVFNFMQLKPAIVPIGWSALFMGLHLYQIVDILQDRNTNINLSLREELLYCKAFLPYGFSPRSFKQLKERANLGWKTYKKGDVIVEQGSKVEETYFVTNGSLRILYQNSCINKVHSDSECGHWVGKVWIEEKEEDGMTWDVSVVADSDVTAVKIDVQVFREIIREDPKRILAADKLQLRELWSRLDSMKHAQHENKTKTIQKVTALQKRQEDETRSAYYNMLELALVDGIITEPEEHILSEFRRRNHITQQTHDELIRLFK